MKKYIEAFLNNVLIQAFLISLILFNVLIFILGTNKCFHGNFNMSIKYFEWFSVVIFTTEYFLRIMSINMIKNILKPMMVIDLFSILPFYLSLLFTNSIVISILSFFRTIRIAKLLRYKDMLIESIKTK